MGRVKKTATPPVGGIVIGSVWRSFDEFLVRVTNVRVEMEVRGQSMWRSNLMIVVDVVSGKKPTAGVLFSLESVLPKHHFFLTCNLLEDRRKDGKAVMRANVVQSRVMAGAGKI